MDLNEINNHISDPQSLNSYSYALNNPVKYVDPNGLDAELTINDKDSTITISSIIYLNGSAYTDEIAQNIQSNITEAWDKGWTYTDSNSGKEYTVKFDIQVKKYSLGGDLLKMVGLNDKANVIDIYDSSRPELYESEWRGGTFVRGGDKGVWEIKSPDPSAHEFGHILGLSDRAGQQNYEGNIMAEGPGAGKVQQSDIDTIVSPYVNQFGQRWFPSWNKSKTYHLNP